MFKTQVASNILFSVDVFEQSKQVGFMATDRTGKTMFFPVDGDKILALASLIQRKFAERPELVHWKASQEPPTTTKQ